MKNPKLILTSECIKVIDAPDENKYQIGNYTYEQVLEKAIKEGVLFNPDKYSRTGLEKGIYFFSNGTGFVMEQGKLYDIPEHYSIKIENNYAYLIPNE